MYFKIKSVLATLSFLAVGYANAITINDDGSWLINGPDGTRTTQFGREFTGQMTYFYVTATDDNASIWVRLDDKIRNCNGAGPVGILRMGSHLGTGTAANKAYANIQTILLTSMLTGQRITIEQDGNCSITSAKVN